MRPSRSMTCNGSFSASRDWGAPPPPVPTGGWGAPPPPKTCEIDEASRSRSPAELHTTRSAVPSGAVTDSLVGSIACASTEVVGSSASVPCALPPGSAVGSNQTSRSRWSSSLLCGKAPGPMPWSGGTRRRRTVAEKRGE